MTGPVLSDKEIDDKVTNGNLKIINYDKAHLSLTSYDMRVDKTYKFSD